MTGRSEQGRRLQDLYPRYRVPLAIDARSSRDAHARASTRRSWPTRTRRPRPRWGRCARRRARRRPQRRLPSALARYATSTGTGSTRGPSCCEGAVYGLTELHREEIAGAGIVANPGCYPTASLLALAPLARAGLIADLVIDAKQGISGAGRAFDETTHLSMAGENILPYKVAAHRHTPEIEEQLDLLVPGHPGLAVQFQAHLVPLDQGEMASCYVTPTRTVAPEELRELFADAYAAEPFVEVVHEPPGVREVRETNYCRMFAAADGHTARCSCSPRSTTSGRAPPRRPSRTST